MARVQKTALHIIYGDKYTSYKEKLKLSNLKTLADRRESLITKFAPKTFYNPKFNSWFSKQQQKELSTRSSKQFLKEVPTRTKRYGNSTIPVITKFINTHYSKNHEEQHCSICDKIFKTLINLNKHIQFKHSKDTFTPQYTSRVF